MDPTETWFLIKQNNIPVNDDVLGEWDTSVLTDGNYILRLTVNRIDHPPTVIFVEDIRVRNYSPLETETPTVTLQVISTNRSESTLNTGTFTITPRSQFTPTPLKKNPAEINPAQIDLYVQRGAIFALVVLGILGIYIISRRQR
jgi:hypothetical protein